MIISPDQKKGVVCKKSKKNHCFRKQQHRVISLHQNTPDQQRSINQNVGIIQGPSPGY